MADRINWTTVIDRVNVRLERFFPDFPAMFRALYFDENMSMRSVSNVTGISDVTLSKKAREHGFTLRSNAAAHFTRAVSTRYTNDTPVAVITPGLGAPCNRCNLKHRNKLSEPCYSMCTERKEWADSLCWTNEKNMNEKNMNEKKLIASVPPPEHVIDAIRDSKIVDPFGRVKGELIKVKFGDRWDNNELEFTMTNGVGGIVVFGVIDEPDRCTEEEKEECAALLWLFLLHNVAGHLRELGFTDFSSIGLER